MVADGARRFVALWIGALRVAFAILLLISVGDLFDANRISDTGLVVRGVAGAKDVFQLAADPPDSARAFVHRGDKVLLLNPRPATRLTVALGNGVPPGTTIELMNVRTGMPFPVVTHPYAQIHTFVRVTVVAVTIGLEGLALFILIARSARREAPALACAIFGLMYASFNSSGAHLGVWYRIAFESAIEETAFLGGCVALVYFAQAIVAWPARVERTFRLVVWTTAGLAWSLSLAGYVGLMAGGRTSFVDVINAVKGPYGSATMLLLAASAFAFSIVRARGVVRSQIVLAGVAALSFAAQYLYSVRAHSSTAAFPDDLLVIFLACQVIGALGLAVAVFGKGLLDPSPRSRTIAFGYATALVVPMFALVEYFIVKLIEERTVDYALGRAIVTAAVVATAMLVHPLQKTVHRFMTTARP